MNSVETGDKVSILVEAKLDTGEQCFQADKDNAIELTVGEGKFFPAIENGLLKMTEGEKKELVLESKDAFGPHMQELVMEAPRTAFKGDASVVVGMRIKIDAPTGKVFYGTIIGITDETVTVDLNHPLAGKTIIFVITVVTITKK